MKKSNFSLCKSFLLLLCVGLFAFSLIACGDPNSGVDTTPPAEVTGVSTTPGKTEIVFSFVEPADADYSYTKVSYKITDASSEELFVVCAKGLPNGTITGLVSGKEYYLKFVTYDETGNASNGVTEIVKTTSDSTSDNINDGKTDVELYAASFTESVVNLKVGGTYTPTITKNPENATSKVTFVASSNKSTVIDTDVVTVNEDGSIKANKNGTAYIFAKWNDKNGSLQYATNVLTINVTSPATSFELKKTEVILKYDEKYKIEITTPEFTTYEKKSFTSSNPKILVSEEGEISTKETTGIIEGTVTVKVDELEAKTISVKFYIPVTSIAFDRDIVITGKTGTVALKTYIYPENATKETIKWSVSDSNIATFENDVVTPKAAGVTTVTVTAGSLSASSTIIVLNSTDNLSITSDSDLKRITSGSYAGYYTDNVAKVAFKYTTVGHATKTQLKEGTGKWDIIGNKGTAAEPSWKSSTYKDAGWGYAVNDKIASLNSSGIAKVGDLQLQVKPILAYEEGVPFVMFVHILKNTGTTALSNQKFGSGTDIQIAGNDKAPVNVTSSGANLIDNSTKMIFALNCLKGEGVTPVDTMWIGDFASSAMGNVYNNKRSDLTNTDSAIAYSWQNISLEPGETKAFVVRLTFVEDTGGSLNAIID